MQTQTQERRAAGRSSRARDTTQPRGRRPNALSMLRQDHEDVAAMFEKFEKGSRRMSPDAKRKLAEQICMALTIHARLEEELFYPQLQDAVKGAEALVAEARVEHETLKRLIADIRSDQPGQDSFDACVTVLGEYTRHHVREEQNEIFPKVRKSKLDIAALGTEMSERKQQLMEAEGAED